MSQKTQIEWTDLSWNPIRGCRRVSEGCRNCYAERVAARFCKPGLAYHGLAESTPSGPRWTGKVQFVEKVLRDPLKWKKPKRVFVNSMSDLFHEDVTDEILDQIFSVISICPQHIFQILTKRPVRMRDYFLSRAGFPLPNVWVGVSVENQAAADQRIPFLLETPALVHWISAEPLLGPLELLYKFMIPAKYTFSTMIDWVVVGGESGPGSRPMDPDWVRLICNECQVSGTAFFFKQWGGTQKKKSGRILYGRTWNQMPEMRISQ